MRGEVFKQKWRGRARVLAGRRSSSRGAFKPGVCAPLAPFPAGSKSRRGDRGVIAKRPGEGASARACSGGGGRGVFGCQRAARGAPLQVLALMRAECHKRALARAKTSMAACKRDRKLSAVTSRLRKPAGSHRMFPARAAPERLRRSLHPHPRPVRGPTRRRARHRPPRPAR